MNYEKALEMYKQMKKENANIYQLLPTKQKIE
jgi:hypothetical protein